MVALLGVSENVCCCICFYCWGLFSRYQSVPLLSLQRCIIWMLHLCLRPQLSSSPPPLRPQIRQRAVFAKAVIHDSKRVKQMTTDTDHLHQLPALKAPYLLPSQQDIEASDTSQRECCTGPCKWLDERKHPALLDPPITLCRSERWTVPGDDSDYLFSGNKPSFAPPLFCFYTFPTPANWQTGH